MANRYFINVGSNWGDTSNWSDTDGGAGGFSVPTSTDNAYFTANSGACTVNASNRTCLDLDFTGYTNTITFTYNITASGNVVLASGMTFAGAGQLKVNGLTKSITSNGKTIGVPFSILTNSGTFTLNDNVTCSEDVTMGVTSSTLTLNGNNLYCQKSITWSLTTGSVIGTTTIHATGTGTLTGGSNTSCSMRNNFVINTSGTITFDTATYFRFNNNTFTYTAGTVVTTNSNIYFGYANLPCTINSDGMTFDGTVGLIGATTHTLTSDMSVPGLLILGNSSSTVTINGYNIYCSDSVTLNNTTGNILGTTKMIMCGKGIVNMTTPTTGRNYLEIIINTAETIGFRNIVQQTTYPIRYIRGQVGGYSEKSMYFNGVNQYISMGNNLNFDINEPFSFAFWFQLTVNGGVLISKANSASPYTGYWIQTSTSQLLLEIYGGTSTSNMISKRSSTTVLSGVWYHGVVTYSGSATPAGIKVYINGVSESGSTAGTTVTGSSVTSYPFNLGGSNNGSWDYTGCLDEVMIFNKVLSQAEVTEIYNKGITIAGERLSCWGDMIAYYRMGEGDSTSTLYDHKGSYDGACAGLTSESIRQNSPGNIIGLPKNLTRII